MPAINHGDPLKRDHGLRRRSVSSPIPGLWVIAIAAVFGFSLPVFGDDASHRYFEQAGRDVRDGRHDDAIRLYHRVLALAPDHTEASRHLSNLLVNQGRLEEAQRVLDLAMRFTLEDPYLWSEQGRVHGLKGQSGMAQIAHDHAVDLNVNDRSILLRAADFYRKQGDLDQAAALRSSANELERHNTESAEVTESIDASN